MNQEILIIGTGAQAKYALEIFRLRNMPVLGMISLSNGSQPKTLYEINVLGSIENFENIYLKNKKPLLLLCCSKNEVKEELVKRFSKYSPCYANAIHPTAVISTTVTLGNGIIVNANTVLQPYAKIDDHVMIHAGVIIEHDCVVCDFVNLAPRVTLAGHVKIGKGTTIYTGSVIIPTVEIGEYSIIGAGSVVLKTIGSNRTLVGVPACEIKIIQETNDGPI